VDLECAGLGLILGLACGILVSILLKLPIQASAVAADAFVGAAASVITADALWRLGVHYNFIAAVILALVLPALHEFYRFKRRRRVAG
jgi:hypothetical protein